MEQQWFRDGLGYWVARLREPLDAFPSGTFVGVGGCAIAPATSWWNLYYRLRPETQGHGLATELCRAALTAARSTLPTLPVVASLLDTNHASKKTAERTGLLLQWEGPDADIDNALRLIYADRALEADQVNRITRYTRFHGVRTI
jgi:RimJ/RimL family protein N-acetyltransferase